MEHASGPGQTPAHIDPVTLAWRRLLGVGLATLLGAADALAQTPAPIPPRAMEQIQMLLDEKASRTPAQRKLDSRLVLGMKKRGGDPMFARMPRMGAPLEVRDGRTLVDVHAAVTPALEKAIRHLGGRIVGSHPRWSELRAWVSMDGLEALAARPDVLGIRPAARPMASVTTQGDAAHRTDTVRSAFPTFDGRGVKVCVLSDGVGSLGQLQAVGELPAVDIVGIREGEEGTEGTAMLEIINDIAPGSTLGFATAFGGLGAFADNIIDLRLSGCQIIVDDVFYGEEAPFQDGPVAQAVDLVAGSGALYFSSAQNSGRTGNGGVWEDDFQGVPGQTPRGPLFINDFGGSTLNRVVRDPGAFALFWAEPFDAAVSDYDMFLFDSSMTLLAASTSFQTPAGRQFAVEAIDSQDIDHTNAQLMIALTGGAARALRLQAFEGRLAIARGGHIVGHAGAVGADAVGAAFAGADPVGAPFPLGLEAFSSDGPRRLFFTPAGQPLTPGNFLFVTGGGVARPKPDLTAADGVSTTTPGFTRFFGTSAAAPHAAAIAAVIKSAAPGLSNDKLRFVLKATARDIAAPGFDKDSGAGIVDALDALLLATAGVPCFDGLDNDGDGGVDFPGDPGCASNASVSESPACNDGVDNDSDGLVDLVDVECRSPAGTTECGMGGAQSMAVVPLLAYFARRRRGRARDA